MVEILTKALILVVIVVIGNLVKRAGWVKATDFPIFSKLVLQITLPCALATSFDGFTIDLALLGLAVVAIVVNMTQQLIGYLQARSGTAVERGFGVLHGGTYNIGAFAIPYLSGFLGPSALVYASLFDVGNSLSAAGLGRSTAHAVATPEKKTTVASYLWTMFASPVFLTYFVLVVIRLLDWHLPAPVLAFTTLVGAANPFLAMLMIGIGLEIRLPRHKLGVAVRVLVTRYVLAALFAAGVWFLLPFPTEVRLTTMMILFAPVASMIPGFTQEIGGDVSISTFVNSVSILVGIVVMPTLYLALSRG